MSARLTLRNRVWHCHFYWGGKRVMRSTKCTDREAAEARAAAMERQAAFLERDGQTTDEARWFRGPWTSFVYFAQAAGEPGSPIKIGTARAPAARLVRLQTGSPKKLHILCAVPGGPSLESALHRAFAKGRLEGEWFAASKRLLRLLAELAEVHAPADAREAAAAPAAPLTVIPGGRARKNGPREGGA
jgi:hypothetical protein